MSNNKTNYLPWIILGGILLVVLSVVAVAAGSYISARNYGNAVEAQLDSILKNNQNIYANGTQKVLEVVQVPTMYKDDLKELVTADIQGRYGADGSKATMQWIKERNLTLDVSMYTTIQQVVQGFRDDFAQNQKVMIDVKRSYATQLGTFWRGFWLNLAGYPKLDLKQFDPIITQRTEDVYKKGKEDGPLKLR